MAPASESEISMLSNQMLSTSHNYLLDLAIHIAETQHDFSLPLTRTAFSLQVCICGPLEGRLLPFLCLFLLYVFLSCVG